MYNVLVEFGIPMKLVRLIKMFLNEMYSRVWVCKNLSDMFPVGNGLKHGDALSPLLFNFALEYAIRTVQVSQDGLKFNGTQQLLVYTNDVTILGGSICTIKKNAEPLVVASKENGLEVNADRLSTWSCLKTRMQEVSHNIEIDNSAFEKGGRVHIFGNNNKSKLYSGRN